MERAGILVNILREPIRLDGSYFTSVGLDLVGECPIHTCHMFESLSGSID